MHGETRDMLDKLLENVDDLAEKLGLPADQAKAIADSLQGKLGDGGDQISALMETAQEHGLSLDKIQGLIGNLGIDADALLEKAGDLLGEGDDGAQGALGGLLGAAKGLFGKS